jgi:DNA-binding NarL/FixJ family response regulator
MKRIRVLLADDHMIFREGLRTLLSLEKDLQVVGEAGDGIEAVRLAADLKPDVAVMDIQMPNVNGIEAACEIRRASPEVRVIGLSVHTDRRLVTGMLAAGARGYLPKNCAGEELVRAIRNVAADQIHISSQVSGVVIEDYMRQLTNSDAPSLRALTDREREVARLLALGWHSKQIAVSLGLKDKTVGAHRQHIMEKLGFSSLADLTRLAIREGLVSPDE